MRRREKQQRWRKRHGRCGAPPTGARWLVALLFCVLPVPALAQDDILRPRVVIETSKGEIRIELFADKTPRTAANFLRYVDEKFFDDTIFHRVIPKFMIQGGGFTPELDLKGTLPPIKIETRTDLPNVRGSVAMARTNDRNSASSQFFINLADNDQLDRSGPRPGYAVFGRVIVGMEVVDRIAAVQTSRRGSMRNVPIFPVIVISTRRAE